MSARRCATKGCRHEPRAQRRGKQFALPRDWFFQFVQESGYAFFHGRERMSLHIDRINPDRGYEVGNVQVLPATENARKRWEEHVPF